MWTKKEEIKDLIGTTNRILRGDKCFEPHYDELNQILKELNEMYERTNDDEIVIHELGKADDKEIANMINRISTIGNKYFEYHREGSEGSGLPPCFDYMIFR